LGNADFVLCRKDGFYSDNRRPDSVEVGTIYDDLARRDFTMNAIAINVETNEIIDPYNGREDIKNFIIKCVDDPYLRLTEDPLRILRAMRFAVTLDFMIGKDTHWSMIENSHKLNTVSIERVMEEINKMFRHNIERTFQVLNVYSEIGVYIFSHPRIQLEARVING
jgi:tRNA nucleotidyltransferase (CCA-adding enzyme)